jgi:hypothetical protein
MNHKPCKRCAGPTSIPATSLLDVVCKRCSAAPAMNVLPAKGTPPVRRGMLRRLLGG